MTDALFTINGDSSDRGYDAAQGELLNLRLKTLPVVGVDSVRFQVWRAANFDPTVDVFVNPPRKAKDSPDLTLSNGVATGGSIAPLAKDGIVQTTLPLQGDVAWKIRCIVNGGQRRLKGGQVVFDRKLMHERIVVIRGANGTRPIIATETDEYDFDGWAAELALYLAQPIPSQMFLQTGTGAQARTVTDRLKDDVYVTDFMTDAEKAAAYSGSWAVDHQPAVQRAVDYALYQNAFGFSSGRKVNLCGLMLRFDRTLHIGYGTDFRSIVIEGGGKREGGTFEGGGCGTVIRCFFNEGVGIAIQGARSTIVRGVTIIGQNADHTFNATFGAASMSQVAASGWVDPALPAAASSRTAPYAGIAIDPYSGPAPVVAYPAVPYPAFLGGVTPQYDKGTSRDVLIEDCRIVGFVVPIAQHPGDADGNGDFTKIRRVSFFFNTYGFSYGNSQARATTLEDCIFAGFHTAFSTSVHGLQIGNPQCTIKACAFETGIQLFEVMNLGYGIGPVFIGCFAEAMYKIGRCNGVSQDAGSIKFINTEIGLSWWSRYGVPTWVLEMEGSHEVRFENVYFYTSGAGRGLLNFRCAGSSIDFTPAMQLSFQGCQTQGDSFTANLYEKCAFNGTLGITVTLGSTQLTGFSVRTGYLRNLDTGNLLGTGVLYNERAIARRSLCAPVYAKRLKSLEGSHDPGVEVAWQQFSFSISSVISTVGRIVTVDIGGLTTQSLMHLGGDVGDVLVSGATGAVFMVKSRTGTQLTLEAMSGFDKDGNMLAGIVAAGILSPIHCRHYAIPAVLYGDITAGNPTVTNLTLGNNQAPADLATILTADDYLWVNQEVDQVINPFDGSARLVSFNTGARTMTFAGNFNYSQTRRRFAVFARPAMPNA